MRLATITTMVTKNLNLRAEYPIEFEVSDGHLIVNATALCAVWGLCAMSWALAKSTRLYSCFVKEIANFPGKLLLEKRWGGNPYGEDLWIHESLVLRLGQWLDASPRVLQQRVECQDYAPAKVEWQCKNWLIQLLPASRVRQLRRTHGVVLRAEAQFLERQPFLCQTTFQV